MASNRLIIWAQMDHAKVQSTLGPALQTSCSVQIVDGFPLNQVGGTEATFLCLGEPVRELFANLGVVTKSKKVGALRHQSIKHGKADLIFSYSPGISVVDYSKYVDLLCDTRDAIRLAETGSLAPAIGDYKYVPDLLQLIAQVEAEYAKTGEPVKLGLDSETLSFDYINPRAWVISLQFTINEGQAQVLYFPTLADQQAAKQGHIGHQLHWLLNTKKVSCRLANGKYDMLWIKHKFGIECTNFKFDTTIVGSLLDENRSNALDVHAKVYTGMGGYSDHFDATVDKSRMDLVPKETLLPYAAGDADATLRVSNAQMSDLLADQELTRFYVHVMHPAARAFEHLESTGALVDMDAYSEVESILIRDMNESVAAAKKVLGGILVAKHYDSSKVGGLNITKASLINDFMFSKSGLGLTPLMLTGKTKEPSSALDHLLMFKNHPEAGPFVQLLEQFSSASKMLSTYVYGFQKHLRADGRFHPSYFLFAGNKDEGEGGTNCMPAGELVLTNRGYLPVEQVRVGDLVVSHEGRPQPVTAVLDNGSHALVEVMLSNGCRLRTTENHAYLTVDGWVEAGLLKIGAVVKTHSGPELWKSVAGWPFEVSSWGRIRSDTGTVLKQFPKGRWGHLKVTLFRNGAQSRGPDKMDFPVHRLVAETFSVDGVGPEVRHLNGLSWDNSVGNLMFGTALENRADAVRHGTMSRRENGQNVLTEAAVDFIRSQPRATRLTGWTNRQLSEKFGVCERLIRAVRSGQRWEPKNHEGSWVKFGEAVVVGVSWLPAEPTYGLTVAHDHSHVTGGIVTHNTGRLSARDPAFQTIPKHNRYAKAIRRIFRAPEGFEVAEFDFSQGELKIAACIANESTMIQSYLDGLDLHVVTSGRFAGYSYEAMMEMAKSGDPKVVDKYDSIRQLGKAGNFGLLYGMGVEGFMIYAEANYGVKLTYEEADAFRNGFFATYPGLPEYHKTYKAFARQHGYVRSPLGRIRHLPLVNSPSREVASKAERQSINSPVQGCLSDMMIWAIAEWNRTGRSRQAPVFGVCHDAGYLYIPTAYRDEMVLSFKETMENLPFEKVGWTPQLKFTADAKIGPTMGDMVKWKKAA